MKTLIILAVILGILFLYFVVNAEKSLFIKGNEVVPVGFDIPKLIVDKVKKITSQISNRKPQILRNNIISDSGPGFINNIITDAKDLLSKTIDKMNESIKSPIENKINKVLCPTK